MIVNERKTPEGRLVSVCDEAVLGETFDNDGVPFEVTEEFYDGEPADEDRVVASLARARVANIVGSEAVDLAVERTELLDRDALHRVHVEPVACGGRRDLEDGLAVRGLEDHEEVVTPEEGVGVLEFGVDVLQFEADIAFSHISW